jgi:cytochrome P450
MRETNPIAWHDDLRYWSVTTYLDVAGILRDPLTFSSEGGMMLGTHRRRGDPAAGRMLVVTDPPGHTRLRGFVQTAFSARTIARLEEHIRATCRALVAEIRGVGRVDFVSAVAARLPALVIAEMLGVPRGDSALLSRLTSAAFGAEDPEYGSFRRQGLSGAEAYVRLFTYFEEAIREKRKKPSDDLISLLLRRVDGESLSDEEILLNCLNLTLGGNETTRHAAAGGMVFLLKDGWQLTRLRADPALIESAVEEILRFTSPATHVLRTARRECVLRGRQIAPGDAVVLWLASANRDGDAFATPADFDVGRQPNRHLTFGAGPHFCLGAALARLELRVLLDEIMRECREIRLEGEPERLRSSFLTGYKSVPLSLA